MVETDQDHAVPWPHGPTEPVNLHLLCRRHHRMKQSGGWDVRLDADGVAVWNSPTGRVYSTTLPLLDTWHDLTGGVRNDVEMVPSANSPGSLKRE